MTGAIGEPGPVGLTAGGPGDTGPTGEKKRLTELKFVLDQPVQAHGELVKELTFKRPTGNDIQEAGYPLHIDMETGDITFDEQKMGAMMVRLGAVPPSTIKMLDAQDWATIAWGLVRFFPPRWQAIMQS